MQQIKPFSDARLDGNCVYCGSYPKTKDHVPSKILLDKPYPENLPAVSSCLKCNNSFSKDEEYFACALECASCGSVIIEDLGREKIKKTLTYNKKLYERIRSAFSIEEGLVIEKERFENVLVKNARGHLVFENSEIEYSQPSNIWFKTIHALTESEKRYFYHMPEISKVHEIGSRGMQRGIQISDSKLYSNWVTVQTGSYSYLVFITLDKKIVRMSIKDYLVCEITWDEHN